MYVYYIYIYMYIYIYIYMNIYIYIYIYLYTYRRGSCGLSLSLYIYMYVSIYIYIYRFTQVTCLQTYLCIILYMYQISMILVQATKNKTSCQIYLPVPVEQTKHSQIPITFEPENCRALGRLQRNSRHTSFAPTDRPGNQAAQSDNLTENSRDLRPHILNQTIGLRALQLSAIAQAERRNRACKIGVYGTRLPLVCRGAAMRRRDPCPRQAEGRGNL